MNIKIPQIEDLPRLLEIRYDAFQANAAQSYTDTEVKTLIQDANLDELRAMIADKTLFVAYIDGKIAGLAGWKDNSLRHVYIDPVYERKGIAKALVLHAEQDYLRRTSSSVLKTGCVLYAVEFYKKLGYRVLQKATDWDGSGYYQLEKDLT